VEAAIHEEIGRALHMEDTSLPVPTHRMSNVSCTNSLQDLNDATGLGHVDFSAFQTNATGELSISGFQDISTSDDGRGDGINLDNASNLVTGSLPSDGPLDLGATLRSPIQQNYNSLLNLQYAYDHPSVDVDLQGQPQRGIPYPAVNVQSIMQQGFDDPFVALTDLDIVQHDYGSYQ
jgi:hypothetical protein